MNIKSKILTTLTCCALLLPLCGAGLAPSGRALAGERRGGGGESGPSAEEAVNRDKVSAALRERAREGRRGRGAGEPVQVVIQLKGKMSGGLNALLNSNGAHVRRELRNLGMAVVELPASAVEALASFDEISYASLDAETEALGHISKTTGADAALAQTYSGISQLNGTGVGIAVVDSGVYDQHAAFLDAAGTASRVVFNKNFVTTESRTDDPYGHGTHVAGLAAGFDRVKGGAYSGVATDAKIIDLRVLDSKGKGQASWLLAALDWLAANHAAYNIRVVNISLGAPAVDSYANDPLCLAVRRLYHLGVVVVAAAGNNGKNAQGQKVYGRVHTPGAEPTALTVGAANTFGTDSRADDAVATYSSRGPTRGYWTDAAGARRYDNLIKPDLVAPGNKLVAAEAYPNYLKSNFGQVNAYDDAEQQRDFMYLSGTSMAAPLVAGAAALMFEVNPKLTAGMARTLLQYTATPLKGFSLLEQGAGELNVAGATRLAELVRRDLDPASAAVGAPLLTAALPAAQTYISDRNYVWAQGVTFDFTYGTGAELVTKFQEGYRPTNHINNDCVVRSDGVVVRDAAKLTAGVLLGRNIMTSAGGVLGTGTAIPYSLRGGGVLLSDGALMNDGALLGDGVLLGDGTLMSDGTLMNDGVLLGDAIGGLSVLVSGDNTAFMAVAP
ncbi:MAG TPA: S8 family serine peptidase [Pyrinomonadaceae bacterium]|jgi:subtilisin family serine protease